MNIQIQDKICIICKLEKTYKKSSYCRICCREKSKNKNANKYKIFPYKGYLYVITNPSWNNWVKIGRALDVSLRLSSYNVGSPFRDYEISYYTQINNPVLIERYFFEKYGTENNEWFNISIDEAIYEIKKFKNEYER